MKQIDMFENQEIAEKKTEGIRKYWYYVTTPKNYSMVAGVAADGSPIMIEHDTRPGAGITPHLFGTRRIAELYRNKWVKGGHVKKWHFSYVASKKRK